MSSEVPIDDDYVMVAGNCVPRSMQLTASEQDAVDQFGWEIARTIGCLPGFADGDVKDSDDETLTAQEGDAID